MLQPGPAAMLAVLAIPDPGHRLTPAGSPHPNWPPDQQSGRERHRRYQRQNFCGFPTNRYRRGWVATDRTRFRRGSGLGGGDAMDAGPSSAQRQKLETSHHAVFQAPHSALSKAFGKPWAQILIRHAGIPTWASTFGGVRVGSIVTTRHATSCEPAEVPARASTALTGSSPRPYPAMSQWLDRRS